MQFSNSKDYQSPPEPFLNYAKKFYDLNLQPIPCNDKKTIVRWKKYQKKLIEEDKIDKWIKNYPEANIGLITGNISNLTIIDCDNLNLSIDQLQDEFGISNFIVKTPRGSYHLYYAFNGERKITNYQDRSIDIISQGCVIIAPFSYNKEKNKYYEIIKGNFDNLKNLSKIKKDISFNYYYNDQENLIKEGSRNDELFYHLKNIAKSYKSYKSLEEEAFNFNIFMEKPLPESEIRATTRSIWNYKVKGGIYTKNRSRKDEILQLSENPTAIMLCEYLRANHNGINRYFNIFQVEVAKELKISTNTLRKAIEFLLQKKMLSRSKISNKKCKLTQREKGFTYEYRFL